MQDHHACAFAHLEGCLLGEYRRIIDAYRLMRLMLIHCRPDGQLLNACGSDQILSFDDWAGLEGQHCSTIIHEEDRVRVLGAMAEGYTGPLACRFVLAGERCCHLQGNMVACDEGGDGPHSILIIGRLVDDREERSTSEAIQRGRRFDRLVDAIPQMVAVAEADGRLAYLNAAGRAMIAHQGGALPSLQACFPDVGGEALSGYAGRTFARRLDGGELMVHLQIMPDGDDSGQMTVIARDLSEHLREEADRDSHLLEMAKAQRMASLGVLVASVAHEINNPNNFIMFNAPILRRIWQQVVDAAAIDDEAAIGKRSWAWARDAVPRLLDGIENGAERIKTMVAQLRHYTRSPDGRQEQRCDANAAINAVIELIAHLIRRHTRHMIIVVPDNLPELRIPQQACEQVLMNILVNACQSLPEDSRAVVLTADHHADQQMVEISIQDEGCGIPPEIVDKLGQSFVTTKSEGTGLGLSIVRRILDQYEGRMVIRSTVGSGTIVTLSLPVADHDE